MPELPEVETLRKGLAAAAAGKAIAGVEVRLPKVVSVGHATVSNIRKTTRGVVKKFESMLAHKKILAVRRRAKLLMVDLSGGLVLLVHLKMTGQLIFAKKGERKKVKFFNRGNSPQAILPHKYTHVIFTFTDGSRLYFNDLRQFGYLRLVRDEDIGKVRELQEFGPEPLSKDFTLRYLLDKSKKRPGISIKQFLMEPKVVAGIGNIYSDEILFEAKLKPTRPVSRVTNQEFGAIYKSIPKVLKKAIKVQGSSVGDFFTVDGSEGKFGKQHKVYGWAGKACYNCGEIIESVKLGGRTSSFCPHCQK
ncbi:bifunctional DNA-formamidopyrimidine glycosylase/DNA-(apurinic or apyrimidinic site) lyase [bacterium]|nr:MAG: bifunctional DNA-formamidopyrimidine glycosylase/DNA-(apurinic or apyrimidinic site) lyase [bacterium]